MRDAMHMVNTPRDTTRRDTMPWGLCSRWYCVTDIAMISSRRRFSGHPVMIANGCQAVLNGSKGGLSTIERDWSG